jgi:phosphohistidine phosphatase
MKTVVFCRHAKSDWPDGVADIDRPLKQRGVDDAQFLGNLLGEKSFQPDLIITSPANRARSTARLIARGISYTEEIRVEPNVYYEGVGSMLELVKELDPSLNSA